MVELLLQQGADVHAKDKGLVPLIKTSITATVYIHDIYWCYYSSGLVPLHNACSYGHREVTEALLRYGANVNALDLWQFTPLHEAASKARSASETLTYTVHTHCIYTVVHMLCV